MANKKFKLCACDVDRDGRIGTEDLKAILQNPKKYGLDPYGKEPDFFNFCGSHYGEKVEPCPVMFPFPIIFLFIGILVLVVLL